MLVLKELFDLTDLQALEELEFNLLWHHALRLTPEEAHLCQKTLHNFRVRLLEHDGGRLAFGEVTGRILEAFGIHVVRQRLDSTHIVSNIATLTRLGLFCETIRVFLRALRAHHPRLYKRVPEGLRSRYVKDDRPTRYEDARSSESRRRLSVCARDVFRLLDRFRGTTGSKRDEYALLERLFDDQCEFTASKAKPDEDDDDVNDEAVPVTLKKPKKVASDSLQTPHDPDVTYSGHKGKGYEVQVSETTDERNAVEIITHVDVTPSSGSDASQTIPVLEVLAEREIQPEELIADTTYGSVENALEAERMGTDLVAPVSGKAAAEAPDGELLGAADFAVHAGYATPTTCPAGRESIQEFVIDDNPNRVEVHFAKDVCESCPLYNRCPARFYQAMNTYVLAVDLVKSTLTKRRRAEATSTFRARYAPRAGIEATNSELKRSHGLGRPRVRGHLRVRLAVFLKATACNVKRMIGAVLRALPTDATRRDAVAVAGS
ncbi:transposase [Planctomycetota bacterium]